MAAIINERDVALQADSPRVVAVNLGSTVNVNGTVNGTPASTVVSNAATGASHAASTGNPHGSDLDAINDGVTYFRTTGNQVTGAGRAYNALNSSSEYIKSLKSTQMTVVGSNPSTGIVMDANGIRMYQSSTLKVNIPVSGDPSFMGDITGDSNINVTGQGRFDGATPQGGSTYAGVFNSSGGSSHGVGAFATTGLGVWGNATSGSGVFGSASTGVGVKAQVTGSGKALEVLGRMTITDTSLVSNLNADMVDGKHASSLCQIVPTDSGTCTVSGNGFNLFVTVANVRSRGTSNIVYIESISDERLKQDIVDETYGLEFINSLRPVEYRLKSRPAIKYHGFIAQEVEHLINGADDALFQTHDDGMHGVDYLSLISPLVKAVQQLSGELNILKQQGAING